MATSDLLLMNALVTTLAEDGRTPAEASAVLIRDGRVTYVGEDAVARTMAGPAVPVIDAGRRRVVPGLIDGHTHFVRAGLTWNDEVQWGREPTLAGALERIAEAAADRPPGTWIKVIGGWHPEQFAERRAPTREELDRSAPGHPVFVQLGYSRGLLSTAALREVDLGKAAAEGLDSGAVDLAGVLRGMAAMRWLYWQLPVPSPEEQVASTAAASLAFSAAGITGLIDGGGANTGPDVYSALYETWRRGLLTVRVRTTVHASRPHAEPEELPGYLRYLAPGFGDDMLRVLGMGEIIHYNVHDGFSRSPDLSEGSLEALYTTFADCARRGWPVQIHAIRADTIEAIVGLWERLDAEIPLAPLRWAIVHGEGMSRATVGRVARLGAGVLVPAMLRFEGEELIEAWGEEAVLQAPPLRALLDAGVPVGGGTDAMRVASYRPFTAMHWYVSGREIGGKRIRAADNLLTRAEALRICTSGSAWFSFEEHQRGRLEPGLRGDLVVLDKDYFTVPEDEIAGIGAELTVVGGVPVWAGPAFR
ncbi:amidohydrolase [Nonomuraea endophytica]|uniref:amidohydrolase n=1 Tax=Nonomuraea endophytica TaxID=714136 RepID=UPI0037C8E643